jgi:hypothetical protein
LVTTANDGARRAFHLTRAGVARVLLFQSQASRKAAHRAALPEFRLRHLGPTAAIFFIHNGFCALA